MRSPHERRTTPEEVARFIVAPCDPATNRMTGKTLQMEALERIVGCST